MFSAVAVADEYYWKSFTSSIHTANAGNIEIMHDRYPDPFSYCAAYADAYVFNTKEKTWRVTGFSVEFKGVARADCRVQLSSVNAPWPSTASALYQFGRYGKNCLAGKIYNPTTGGCGYDNQKGLPPPLSCVGNPINVSLGNKFQIESDYRDSTGGLFFFHAYNSLDGFWRHGYSTYLRFALDKVSLVFSHGREVFFVLNGDVTIPASIDVGVLVKNNNNWHFLSAENERFVFNAAGRLISWSNASGVIHRLTYSGNIVTVTDHLGNSLSFTEGSNHQPLVMNAPGVQVTYEYDASQRLSSVRRVVDGEVTQRKYHYEVMDNPNLLTGITDELGVRYATWSYDAEGRAISSEHAGGADRVEIAYNDDGSATVTNELGKKATYRFQTIQGIKRITAIEGEPSPNCPSSNSTFTYDDRGLLKTKTDNKGIVTTYDYNDRGLEVTRTEAIGTPQARTVTTEWHPSMYLPLAVTEPDRITRYQYNAQGGQLSRTVENR